MITNLSQKYKDRDPLQTVVIIQKFFHQYGFQVIEEIIEQSEVGTFWCGLSLMLENNEVCRSNGKGASIEFALASGYAELYERFCAGFGTYNLDLIYKKLVYDERYLKNNYYLHKEEKFEDFETIKKSCNKIENFFNNYFPDKNNYLFKIYNTILKNDQNNNILQTKSLMVPYTNLFTNEQKFLPNFLLGVIEGSNGLAAGNTIEEALVQGLSELYERFAQQQLFDNRSNLYYILDLNKIMIPQYLQEYINNIKKLGYEFYIYDLSYNYNVPALLMVLIDPIKHVWYANLGAHPIFEIALERIITEMYQGIINFQQDKKYIMYPSKYVNHNDINDLRNTASMQIYPEELLMNTVVINQYNKMIFLSGEKEYANNVLLEKLIEIGKNNNLNIYYFDLSLTKDIKAIRIFIDNIQMFDINKFKDIQQIKDIEIFLNSYYIILSYLISILNNAQLSNSDYNIIIYHLQNLNIFLSEHQNLYWLLIFNQWSLYLFIDYSTPNNFYNSLKYEIENEYIIDEELKNKFLYYYFIHTYSNSLYDLSEIKFLMNRLGFNVQKLEYDFNNLLHTKIDFLFKDILETFYKKIFNKIKNTNAIDIFIKEKE